MVSVDVLRGFVMFWLIGGQAVARAAAERWDGGTGRWLARQLTHVPWEGGTFWDLIMPLFLFVTGVSIPLALGRRRSRGDSMARMHGAIARRVLILFVLGMVAQGHLLDFSLARLAIFSNTLQAIAAGYLVAALAFLHVEMRGRIVLFLALLLGYGVLLLWAPTPGYGAGVLTPEGNWAMWVDRMVLGRFRDGTQYTWLITSMGFGATVLLGTFAGSRLPSGVSVRRAATEFLGAGAVLIAAGWLWGYSLPIIKPIWSSSFILWSGGWCLVFLGAFHGIVEAAGFRRWAAPFQVVGANALVAYMLVETPGFRSAWRQMSDALLHGLYPRIGAWTPVAQEAGILALIFLALLWMYRKKCFVKI